MIVNDRPGSESEAFTCVAACVVLDSCHCLHIGRVWSLYWHLSYDGVLCEAWRGCVICLMSGASFFIDTEGNAEDLRK